MRQLNKIVFLSRLPPLSVFLKTYGINYLISRGFSVVFLDLSVYVDGEKVLNLYDQKDFFHNCEVVKIRSLLDFDSYVKQSRQTSIFIDFMAGFSDYDFKVGEIFRTLKKYNAKYYLIANGELPPLCRGKKKYFFELASKLRRVIFDPKILMNLIFL